jgi:iron complex transport system ATP-binding protein
MPDVLTASNVWFAYGEKPVLRIAAMTLKPGEVVALLGPNGSGKSTLIRAVLGLVEARGEIHWLDRALSQWTRRELARKIAYLPQNPSYEPAQTVAHVLRLGRAPYWSAFGIESPRDEKAVNDVAAMLELADLLARPMDELSGGQRQRVFVGRCLVQEPLAMLLDEPNTFLDLKHQVELSQLLRKLAREKSIGVLLASHDLNLAGSFADRLLLLREGQIIAQGSPQDVLREEVLSSTYGLPIERIDRGESKSPIVVPKISDKP